MQSDLGTVKKLAAEGRDIPFFLYFAISHDSQHAGNQGMSKSHSSVLPFPRSWPSNGAFWTSGSSFDKWQEHMLRFMAKHILSNSEAF